MQAALAVFILEDEALIRMMIVEMVEQLGHRVVAEAGSVSEALPLAERAEFDLALLDINVGTDNSADIAAIVEGRSRPFIFVSGYNATGLPAPFHEPRVLQKPFPLEALRRAIELAISPEEGGGPRVKQPGDLASNARRDSAAYRAET